MDLFDDSEWDLPEILVNFPEADFRFNMLNGYIDVLAESVSFTFEQSRQRIVARIAAEGDPVTKAELECDLLSIDESGIEKLAHLVWGGVLTSVFATFESNISTILRYCSKELALPKFKKEPRKSFLQSAYNWSWQHLSIPIYDTSQQEVVITHLAQLRNSYVHNGCEVTLLASDLREAIEEKKYGKYAVKADNGIWYANEKNTKLYLHFTRECYRAFEWKVSSSISSKC